MFAAFVAAVPKDGTAFNAGSARPPLSSTFCPLMTRSAGRLSAVAESESLGRAVGTPPAGIVLLAVGEDTLARLLSANVDVVSHSCIMIRRKSSLVSFEDSSRFSRS